MIKNSQLIKYKVLKRIDIGFSSFTDKTMLDDPGIETFCVDTKAREILVVLESF